MSVQSLAWVLEDAGVPLPDGTVDDVPAELVSPLLGLANHADQEGRHAYPSQATLARYTRKSERQVRRDLVRLEELGLIRRGDQRLVLHIDPDRRPVVYDLAVEVKRAPREPAEPRGGRRPNGGTPTSPRLDQAKQRGDTHVPPVTGDRNGGTPVTERGDTHVRGTVQEPPKGTNEVGTEVGNGTSGPPSTTERPSPSCTLDHAAGAACGACRADRLALEAYEAGLTAADRQRARELADADRVAQRAARSLADLEAGSCGLCDVDGRALVEVPGQPKPLGVRCWHDADVNLRAVTARLAARSTVAAVLTPPPVTDAERQLVDASSTTASPASSPTTAREA